MAKYPQLINLAKRLLAPFFKKNLSILFCRFEMFQNEKLLEEREAVCLPLPPPTFPDWEVEMS